MVRRSHPAAATRASAKRPRRARSEIKVRSYSEPRAAVDVRASVVVEPVQDRLGRGEEVDPGLGGDRHVEADRPLETAAVADRVADAEDRRERIAADHRDRLLVLMTEP